MRKDGQLERMMRKHPLAKGGAAKTAAPSEAAVDRGVKQDGTPPTPAESALDTALAHLTELLEADAVPEARVWVRELQAQWPDSEKVRHWARVLEPPRSWGERGKGMRALHQKRAWLREHAHEHPGCWLAVYKDRLIAADADFRKVVAATRQSIGDERALLHFQPGQPERE
jgi:hypothetical protein